MKHLSGLDSVFLHLETPEMPMHVGALHLFELPAGFRGSFVTALRKHIASRLPIAPPLRRTLAQLPMNLANPGWVPAVPDMKHHIVGHKLPRGSGLAEVEALVGQLHPVLLERDRPLWKFHVIEGLAPGPNKARRVAMYTQLHHAAVDGQAAVALASAILDTTPVPRDIEVAAKPARRFRLGSSQMIRGMVANELKQVGDLAKALPGSAAALTQMARQGLGSLAGSAVDKLLEAVIPSRKAAAKAAPKVSNLGLAPRTPFNASVTTSRAFAAVSLPLMELKLLRKALDASLNDVVLMACSGALRTWFEQAQREGRTRLPKTSLVAAVPVSLRAAGDTTANNQASMTLVKLGTHLADRAERVAFVKAASASMKQNLGSIKTLMPVDFPSLGLPWLLGTATRLYGRAKVADRIPPVANVVISNVPGPGFPLYLAGARMLTNYPTSIVVHGMGLNITVQTYDQSLDVGLIACGEAMPDIALLAQALRDEIDALKALAAG
jgi:WS/DGAT/MGAT family acyltransferase